MSVRSRHLLIIALAMVCLVAHAQDPVMAVAAQLAKDPKLVREWLHTETQSRMRGLVRTPGFQYIDIRSHISKREGVSLELATNAVVRTFDHVASLAKRQDTKDAIHSLKQEALTVLNGDMKAMEDHVMALFFENNEGKYEGFYFMVGRSTWKNGTTWNFASAIVSGSFKPAPDYVVITQSKKSLLSSSTKDILVPLNRGLTQPQVNDLMLMAIPRLAAVVAKVGDASLACDGPDCERQRIRVEPWSLDEEPSPGAMGAAAPQI
eukprot:TRINITY_DN1682_c0_g1_i1.p1 TRINITY_DN1682_c0_g1~~TRINITY_DN1682_c0_g1_i1.p1  ORF type:complete len:264 (+),score=37.57 TRINITY_DN1682_c0_g1_i1:2-793(+)